MSSSRRETFPRQVPAPANSRVQAAAYTRFIPREELQGFASWSPDAFNTPLPEPTGFDGGTLLDLGEPRVSPPWQPPADQPVGPTADEIADAVADQAAADAAELADLRERALREELTAAFEQRLAHETATQAQAARQQGYQDGYRDGLVALDSFKQSYAQQVSTQVGAVVQSLDGELRAMEQQLANTVTRVATELARQVVRGELALRPALIAQVAQEAVNAVLVSAQHITVLLHPDDHALVAQGCAEALNARGARLVAQPTVARGGCKVESDAGTIDARIGARWAQATLALGTGIGWTDDEQQPGADA